MRNAYKILFGKPEGKAIQKPRRIREDKNITNLWEGVDWCGSGEELVARSREQGNEPSGPVKGWKFLN